MDAKVREPRAGEPNDCHAPRRAGSCARTRPAARTALLAAALLAAGPAPWQAVAAQGVVPPAAPRSDARASVPESAVSRAAGATYRLRIVGNLGALSQYSRREAPFWAQELPRLSGGRFTASIVPFDRAGVPGIEMLRLIELGVVPMGTVLMSSLTAQYP
ncbi:hypothetical protein, partial [Raoultella terrigena]|uniref:hypothetical protein n=1 Tax=Raoultella terrigena TaxID=577 RepID=UPI001C70067F